MSSANVPSPCSQDTTRLCLKSANGEELSFLDGSNWHVTGLSAMITATWKIGDEIASRFGELFHCRTNEHVAARRGPDELAVAKWDRRRVHCEGMPGVPDPANLGRRRRD